MVSRPKASTRNPGTLGEWVKLVRGTTYKGYLVGKPGPVLLGLSSISPNGGFRRTNFETYGGDCAKNIVVNSGDIYVSLKDVTQSADLLGAVARLPKDISSGRLTQDTVRLIAIRKDTPWDYIYWLLRTPQYRNFCSRYATGTTTLGLGRDDFLGYPVPDFTDQRRFIVQALQAIERRHEELSFQSETLESLARAIFKSWFVDFDPVRAKAEGREPDGMDAATAALFPCELVPAEEGMMPAGWNEGVLEDVCEVAKIGVQKTDMRSDENYVGLEHIPRESWSLASWGTAENLQSGKSRFQQGDILFGKLRPYFHKVCIAPVDGVCSTDILVLRPKNPEWMAFALCLVSSKQMIDYATRLSNGAKMPRSSWHDLSVYKAILPPESLAEAFNRIVEPIVGRIIANVYTAATLTALRDTLLPRLISGKLRVPEAEAILTEV